MGNLQPAKHNPAKKEMMDGRQGMIPVSEGKRIHEDKSADPFDIANFAKCFVYKPPSCTYISCLVC